MKTILAVLALSFLTTTAAQAHILFEPSLGYAMGTLTNTTSADVQTKSDLSAPSVGLRLAWMSPIRLWIGVDGDYVFGKGKAKDVSPGTEDTFDFTSTTGSISLGYETLHRIRLYASYGVFDSLVLKEDGNSALGDTIFTGGNPIKIGWGYHLTQSIAVNIEYAMHDYKKVKNNLINDTEINQVGLKSQKIQTYGLNFSLPFFW